jgi:polysaccharide export outer membrane protein
MRITVLLFSLFGFVVFSACGPQPLRVQEFRLPAETNNPMRPPDEFYVIGYGDVISVNIWREPTISGTAKVRPDGYISLPLINEVQAVGLTTGELRKVLEEKYKEFTVNPFVTLRVEQIASVEVFLVGQVNRPGAYPLVGNDTILQLLTRAGGLTIFADRRNLRLVRREKDKVTEYVIDYDAIIQGDLKQDILVRPGDRIIAP